MGRKEFCERMVALANMVQNFILAPETLRQWERQLVPILGWERLIAALDKIILERKSRDPFPVPSEVMAMYDPKADPETIAVNTANSIIAAVGTCGRTNRKRALEKIGPFAMQVAEEFEGSWEALCMNLEVDKIPSYRAQLTKLALAVQKRVASGDSAGRPALPQPRVQQSAPTSSGELRGFGDLVKQIAHKQKS